MSFLAELWMPIAISSVPVFVASSVIHYAAIAGATFGWLWPH